MTFSREEILNKLLIRKTNTKELTEADLGPYTMGQLQTARNIFLLLKKRGFTQDDLHTYINKHILTVERRNKAKARERKKEQELGLTAGDRERLEHMSKRQAKKYIKRRARKARQKQSRKRRIG